MPKSHAELIEKLQDQVYALQQLLLSHILAFDLVDRPATDATFDIVMGQSTAALASGRTRVAIRIDAMIDDIKKGRN